MMDDKKQVGLAQVKASFTETLSQMERSVRELFPGSLFDVSESLLETLKVDRERLDIKIDRTCQALEVLSGALWIREKPYDNEKQKEDHLIAVDYLYAQAIDLVVTINEPAIISILARVITQSAEAKLLESERNYKEFLQRAEREIALHLRNLYDEGENANQKTSF